MSRDHRFLVAPEEIDDVRAVIRGEELHHLAHVLRLRAGDEVRIFDGRGRGFHARIDSIGRSEAIALIGAPEDPGVEPACRAVLLQGIPHGERMDWIVEKATEIGAAAIVPVLGARSVVRPRSGGWSKVDRWRRIALAAAKQSGRLVVPEVAEPISFADALRWGPGDPADLRLWTRLIFHPGAASCVPLDPSGAAAGAFPSAGAALLVGPEGGWTDEEVASAAGAGWSPAGLGRRILRADTAAVVALGILLLAERRGG